MVDATAREALAAHLRSSAGGLQIWLAKFADWPEWRDAAYLRAAIAVAHALCAQDEDAEHRGALQAIERWLLRPDQDRLSEVQKYRYLTSLSGLATAQGAAREAACQKYIARRLERFSGGEAAVRAAVAAELLPWLLETGDPVAARETQAPEPGAQPRPPPPRARRPLPGPVAGDPAVLFIHLDSSGHIEACEKTRDAALKVLQNLQDKAQIAGYMLELVKTEEGAAEAHLLFGVRFPCPFVWCGVQAATPGTPPEELLAATELGFVRWG